MLNDCLAPRIVKSAMKAITEIRIASRFIKIYFCDQADCVVFVAVQKLKIDHIKVIHSV